MVGTAKSFPDTSATYRRMGSLGDLEGSILRAVPLQESTRQSVPEACRLVNIALLDEYTILQDKSQVPRSMHTSSLLAIIQEVGPKR
jgi:hypothetical protein